MLDEDRKELPRDDKFLFCKVAGTQRNENLTSKHERPYKINLEDGIGEHNEKGKYYKYTDIYKSKS